MPLGTKNVPTFTYTALHKKVEIVTTLLGNEFI